MSTTDNSFLEIMQAVAQEAREIAALPRDPVTGRLDLDVVQGMSPEQLAYLSPGAKDTLDQLLNIAIPKPLPDIATFDFQSLVVEPGTRWSLEILYAGNVGANGEVIAVDHGTGNASPGAQARFSYRCAHNGLQTVGIGNYRQVSQVPEELTAEKLVDFLRVMIVHPRPPGTPGLPECLLLPVEVSRFQHELWDFLDTLPATFTWRIESSSETVARMLAFKARRKRDLEMILEVMNARKKDGNVAFRKGDRDTAIEWYTAAMTVTDMEDDIMGIFSGQEEQKKEMLAICYSNRAAAYLLPGAGLDPVQAIKDGEEAEKRDPTFKKAYLRQARGYTMLRNNKKAKEVLERALQCKALTQDSYLLEALALLKV